MRLYERQAPESSFGVLGSALSKMRLDRGRHIGYKYSCFILVGPRPLEGYHHSRRPKKRRLKIQICQNG